MAENKAIKYFFILFFIFIVFFSVSTDLPTRHNGGFFSDEATYFAITQSLAYDLDIRYEAKDYQRIKSRFSLGPTGLFLKKGKNEQFYYAKSFAYPLFAAPFFRLFDINGLLLFNGLMLFMSIWLAFQFMRCYFPEAKSFFLAIIFVLASVVPIYIWWTTADLFNFFFMFCGLFFFFYPFKNKRWFYLSSLFFSVIVFSKAWSIVPPIGIIYLILVYRKEWKRFFLMALLSVLIFSLFLLFLYAQTGELTYKLYMGGERRSFQFEFPFAKSESSFDSGHKMSADDYWERFHISPQVLISNFFYFIFGRFTGVFIYFFPAVFLLILFFFQKKIPEDWFLLTAILLAILIFTSLAPSNYFGGSGSLGNRYFMILYPLFFFLGFRKRLMKGLIFPAVISLIFLSGVYTDGLFHSSFPRFTGLSFPARLFPPEKTQYLSLPTNENFRAFGRDVSNPGGDYKIFFLNDNFYGMENSGAFWSRSKRSLEAFIVSPHKVKRFEIQIKNNPLSNRVTVRLEHKTRRLFIKPEQHIQLRFNNISALKMGQRYIYHLRVKSSSYWSPHFEDPDNDDTRLLGVQTQILLHY